MGNAVRFILIAGQASEYGQANTLIEGMSADFVLADKGYNSDSFIVAIKDIGAEPVLPPRSNRASPRRYDREVDKERNLVERLFQSSRILAA